MIVVGAILLYSIPSDYELALFHAMSFESDKAKPFIRRAATKEPNSAVTLRHLADVLEAQGKIDEAIALTEKLTKLKPRNRQYWDRLLRLLIWRGKEFEALQVREKLLESGLEPMSRKKMLELSQDFEWLQKYEDANRIYHRMRKLQLYSREDVNNILRVYFALRKVSEAEAFALEAREKGMVGQEVHLTLFWCLMELGIIQKATEHAALYLGAPPYEAKTAWMDTSYIAQLDPDTIKREQKFLKDLLWVYVDRGKQDLSLPFFRRVREVGALDKRLHYAFVDILIGLEEKDEAVSVLKDMVGTSRSLSAQDWFEIVQRFSQVGDKKTAASILETILNGRRPAFDDRGAFFKGGNLIFAQGSADTVVLQVTVRDRAVDAAQKIISNLKLHEKDRLKAYDLLVEIYDSQSEFKNSSYWLTKLLEDIRAKRIHLNPSSHLSVKERLAERWMWQSRPGQALSALAGTKFHALTPKGKAIRILALDEMSETKEAGWLLAQMTAEDRARLATEEQKRLYDLEDRWEKEQELLIQEREIATVSAAPSVTHYAIDNILEKPTYFVASSGLLRTPSQLAPSMGVSAHMGHRSDPWAMVVKGKTAYLMDNSQLYGAGTAGMEYRGKNFRAGAQAGYQGGGNYFNPQLDAEVGGTFFGMDYSSVTFHLAEALLDTSALVQNSVSETRLGTYFERGIGQWFSLAGSILGRLSHVGNMLSQGRGVEVSLRGGFGRRLRGGPWVYWLRWGTDNSTLSPLLVRQYSIVGGFGEFRWGGKLNMA